ncbi:Uncharacterised protein [uncultured Eubacterium sp.]|nr:Uncharacterised protein [uncultured Eubacterium sp.]
MKTSYGVLGENPLISEKQTFFSMLAPTLLIKEMICSQTKEKLAAAENAAASFSLVCDNLFYNNFSIILIITVMIPAILNENNIHPRMLPQDIGFTRYTIDPIKQIANIARKMYSDFIFIISIPCFFLQTWSIRFGYLSCF